MAWQQALLVALAAPTSGTNVEALSLWAQSEGMPASTNNWLACGETWPGAGTWNSAGVKVYPSENAGIGATAAALSAGDYGYPAIVQAFQADAGLGAIWRAVNASGWCHGCQSGHYPVVLFEALGHGGAPTTPGRSTTVVNNPVVKSGQATYDDVWGQIHQLLNQTSAGLYHRLQNAATAASEVG